MAAEYIIVNSTPAASVTVDVPITYEKTYIGNNNPNFAQAGIWIQTGLGPSGNDITIWYEDGQ